jgi:hypothetical protein
MYFKTKKSQAAAEMIVILAIVLAILTTVIVINNKIMTGTSGKIESTKARAAVDSLSDAAELVYQQGVGSRTRVFITLPDEIQSFTASNQTLNMELYAGGSLKDVYRSFDFNVSGTLPDEEGNYWLYVESKQGYVGLGTEIITKTFYLVTSGSDASSGTPAAFTSSDISDLAADDASLMASDANWPKNSPGYDEGKYIEFIYSPNLIASSISSVTITNVYQKSADKDIAAKLEVWDQSTSSWVNETLTTPDSKNTDQEEVVDVSSYITTADDINNIRIRFLAYVVPNANVKTNHDYISVNATYVS